MKVKHCINKIILLEKHELELFWEKHRFYLILLCQPMALYHIQENWTY